MGLNLFQPWNADLMFSPDQWSNQFSKFNDAPLPFPPAIAGNPWTGQAPQQPGDVGWPTDALGNPIQVPKGVTLNTSPAAAPPPAAAPQQNNNQAALNMLLTQSALANTPEGTPDAGGRGAYTGLGGTPFGVPLLNALQQQRAQANAARGPVDPNQSAASWIQQMSGQSLAGAPGAAPPAAAASAAPAAAGGGGLTYPQYLSLLANPGPVPTYGATVPQSPTAYQPGSGVLQNFLANWKPAQSGPSSAFQQAFAAALQPSVAAAPAASSGGGRRRG